MGSPTLLIEVQLELSKAISSLLTVAVKIDVEAWETARVELAEVQDRCARISRYLDQISNKADVVRR